MMDWTDRHCRYFHRLLSARALLYTEMVTSAAIVRGGALRLLDHDPAEHPVALQLGGSDPAELAQAARLGADAGYDEINLNVGCPSDRVQSGCFGAMLMKNAALVAACVSAMAEASAVEVTVKCRIGVDDQIPADTLPVFLETLRAAGLRRVIIHARMAWLDGLSPKENRDIPPLDYGLVHAMKREFPDLHISVNGGIASLNAAVAQLSAGMDGVMIGRAAYHNPADILASADRDIWGDARVADPVAVAEAMIPYVDAHVASGGRAHSVTRHMLGLFAGKPGARGWRRLLSQEAVRPGADGRVIADALAYMTGARAAAE
jgi:tRNA-dihydrouridine synthase A